MLDFGADPNSKDSSGLSGLHYAAQHGHINICLLLLTRGGDPNIRDDFGNNASYWAKRNNHNEILQYLPAPLTVFPIENKDYYDMVDEFTWGITADDKKKKKGGKGK